MQLFVPSTYRCYMCNMERIGLTVSEEMSFENVDGRTDDGYLYILKAHICAFGSGELKIWKISAKIHEIGKIKAIFGLGMTPI